MSFSGSTNMSNNHHTLNRILLVSGVSGGVASIIKTAISSVFFYSGLSNWFSLIDAGSIIFRSTVFQLDFWHLFLALITHILWGGILAIGLGLLIYYFVGTKHFMLFSGVYGFFIWISVRNFLSAISFPEGLPPLDAPSVAVSMPSHIIWGVVAGFLIIKLVPVEKT